MDTWKRQFNKSGPAPVSWNWILRRKPFRILGKTFAAGIRGIKAAPGHSVVGHCISFDLKPVTLSQVIKDLNVVQVFNMARSREITYYTGFRIESRVYIVVDCSYKICSNPRVLRCSCANKHLVIRSRYAMMQRTV